MERMAGLIPHIEMLSKKLACSSAVVAWTFALSLRSEVADPVHPKNYTVSLQRKGPFHKQGCREFPSHIKALPTCFFPACM